MSVLPDNVNPNTSSPTVLSRLYEQESQLRAQIAAAQADANRTDPNGDPAAASFTAAKVLPGLQDSYRLVLNSIASIEAKTPAQPKTATGALDQVKDPRTGAVIGLRDPVSGQVTNLPATPAAKGTPNSIVYVPGTTTAIGLYDSTGTYRDIPNAAAADKSAPVAGNTTSQFILTRMPDGSMRQEPNPNYQTPQSTAAPKPAKGATRLSTQTANNQVYTIQEIADGMGGWSVDPSYKAQVAIGKETTPGADAYQTAQTENLNAGTAKTLRDMQPAGAKAIQDMYDSIGAVQGMMEKGTMSPAEASSYMEAFKQNLMAAQQGTTPWAMKTDQQAEDRNRADIGRQLLNQKLTSSSGMAQSLIGMLGSVGGKLADIPGGVHFDPFGMAAQFTDQQSGGQEMSDLAKTLLGTLKPGAGTAPSQPTATPQSAGIPGGDPNAALNVLAQHFKQTALAGAGPQGQAPNLGYTFNPGTPASIPGGLGGQAPASSGGMFINPGAQQPELDPVMQTIIQMLAAQPDLKLGLGR